MKMTPEQKAFFEYGKVWSELKRLRKEIVYNLARYRGIKKNGAILIFRKCLCERDVLIKEAWRKRAACRAWAVPLIRRDCYNCSYSNIKPTPIVCAPCINEGFAVNWEPRKEGE